MFQDQRLFAGPGRTNDDRSKSCNSDVTANRDRKEMPWFREVSAPQRSASAWPPLSRPMLLLKLPLKTLNVRGQRSKTDKADNDPKMSDALEIARAQDAHFARTGEFVGPLHGIPFAIKDNYDTVDMRTTAGAAAAYANDKPPKDATMVAKLRAAGAIILGKTNLDEYAPAGIARSTLGGQTCNPYDTKRVPAGSSGGSGAAVAANLAICALGTDTAGSVRNPASANSLVGMVASQGLVSRAGIIPLSFSRDRGGPLCRTVRDTAAVLEVIEGADPRDEVTAVAHGRKPIAYQDYAGRT